VPVMLTAKIKTLSATYIVEPSQSVSLGVGSDVAFKINIISLFDVIWV
jgi:hypothetical protein